MERLKCWWNLCKGWCLVMHIQWQLHVYLKNLTLKFNCYICWTVWVVSIELAGYVMWMLTYKYWKIGSNLFYLCWNTEFFSRDYFLLADVARSVCVLYVCVWQNHALCEQCLNGLRCCLGCRLVWGTWNHVLWSRSCSRVDSFEWGHVPACCKW